MLLPAYAACVHCISLLNVLVDYLLLHQMHRKELLVACSSTALFKCSTSFLHVLFVHVLIAVCDCSLLLQAISAQHRERSAAQEDHKLFSQRAAANGQQPGDADGQLERQAPGNVGDEQQAGSSAAGAELRAAWDAWQALQELLTVQRYWWKKLHFRYAHKAFLERKRESTDISFVLQAHARYTSLSASQQHLHQYACMPRTCEKRSWQACLNWDFCTSCC